MSDDGLKLGPLGVFGWRNYMGRGGWPFLSNGPARYADGAVGTPNPPVPTGHSPFYQWNAETQQLEPIPGSPADR